MPIRMGKKRYKSFAGAKRAIMKKKGLSAKRAAAYVASIERRQGRDPRTGKRIRKGKRKRR